MKLLDDENGILIRKTPRQLRMDESYCAPFSLTATSLKASVGGHLFLLSTVTAGTYYNAWNKFLNIFERENKVEETPASGESSSTNVCIENILGNFSEFSDEMTGPTSVELVAEGITLYYQPNDMSSGGKSSMYNRTMPDMYIVPPRGLVTINYLKVNFHRKFVENSRKIQVASHPVVTSSSSVISCTSNGIKLWLKEDFHHLGNGEIWFDLCHPNIESHFSVSFLLIFNKISIKFLVVIDTNIRVNV